MLVYSFLTQIHMTFACTILVDNFNGMKSLCKE